MLLNIASPDAVLRMKHSKLVCEFPEVYQTYFSEQSHISLFELLDHTLATFNTQNAGSLQRHTWRKGLLLQVTTNSHLLSDPDVTQLCKALKLPRENITCQLLQEFDTEMDFCNKLKYVI